MKACEVHFQSLRRNPYDTERKRRNAQTLKLLKVLVMTIDALGHFQTG